MSAPKRPTHQGARVDRSLGQDCSHAALIVARDRLHRAIERERSLKWCLRLWARFVKARDGNKCVSCGSSSAIHAHHIVRRTLYPWGMLELGNGITLCRDCHRRVHDEFNGRPDLTEPLGAQGGDDQDEWAYLFGILRDDAVARRIDEDEFYFLGDFMLRFFTKVQGYEELYEFVQQGKLSRIRFAHEIWRTMPQSFYENFGTKLIELNWPTSAVTKQ